MNWIAMRITDSKEIDKIKGIIDQYNDCFYRRDLERLKNLYVPDGDIIYFDNHEGCDSTNLTDHLTEVGKFFETGKIEELISEDMVVYQHGDCACLLIKLRYPSKPRPCVRTTYYLENHDHQWKIRHIHCSFDPNELQNGTY